MAVLVGLMFGSLRVLWPWPNGVGVISRHEHEVGTGLDWPTAGEWAAPTVAAAIGFAWCWSSPASPGTDWAGVRARPLSQRL